MAIVPGSNFHYKGKRFLDERQQLATKKLLLEYTESLPEGFEVYCIEDKNWYGYSKDRWNSLTGHFAKRTSESAAASNSIPVVNDNVLSQLSTPPSEYLLIPNPDIEAGEITGNVIHTQNNGRYVDVLFLTVRALLSEVAKLKNTFYYGIQSYDEGVTSTSNIILDADTEIQEPLWAIDPEDLDAIPEACVSINSSSELLPRANWSYKSNKDVLYVSALSKTQELLSLELLEEYESINKLISYGVIYPEDNYEYKINLRNGKVLDLRNFISAVSERLNVMFIVSRKITTYSYDLNSSGEEIKTPTGTIGRNYYHLTITNQKNETLVSTYLNETLSAVSLQPDLDTISNIKHIELNKLYLYKLDLYSKDLSFSNDSDLIPERPLFDDFKYKAAHITIRSVEKYETLDSIITRLLPNEPIICWDEDESKAGLYIKTKYNTLKKIGGSNNSSTTGMTQDEMISWLINKLLIISVNDGYLLNPNSIDFSSIDPNEFKFSGINIVNEDTEEEFEIKVDYKGDLVVNKVDPIQLSAASDSNNDDSTAIASRRGAAARYSLNLLNNKLANTTDDKTVSSVTVNASLEVVETALGDRVRLGSWYIPNLNLTSFHCSHDFIEIVNSGTFSYPLYDACLGIIYRNSVAKADNENLYGKHYSIQTYDLTGVIDKKSSYLIRGKKRCSHSDAKIHIENYDYKIDFDFVNKDCAGILLFHKSLKPYLTQGSGTEQDPIKLRALAADNNDTSDNGTFKKVVDSRLIDVITFSAHTKYLLTLSSGGEPLYTEKGYEKTDDMIGKDQYSLDPAKQGFRSLTLESKESSNCRLTKVAGEQIPLTSDNVSFPHSANSTPVLKYTPKASSLKKNILTDKTAPDFNKPNMVNCSFGINAATTRCFNWFSMSKNNEYVWIRKKGSSVWNRFESYKYGDGSTSVSEDTNTQMHRKEFTVDVVNAIYARIDNVFPGDDSYLYRAHKCIVYILPEMTTGDPVEYEYLVGPANNLGLPVYSSVFDLQYFTIYPLDWKPKVYQTTDQQGFGWMEYQEWAAAAEEVNKQIIKDCNKDTKLFPVFINTGDMTQNGTRVNEWLDYHNAGKSIFTHVEQMCVVGNNDLCNSYSETALGNGDDDGKTSPYYFHVFYCYEVENVETIVSTDREEMSRWSHPLIYNGIYVPSMYYFYHGVYGYLMVNSEITPTTCYRYFKQSGDVTINLYTGCKSNASTLLTALDPSFLGSTLLTWINTLKARGCQAKNIVVACHEMPFTVTTMQNLKTGQNSTDRSISAGKLVGSHLNVLGPAWLDKDYTYWFSNMLLDNGIKVCIGGHKHTYAITYPVKDLANGKTAIKELGGYHFSKKAKIARLNVPGSVLDNTIDSNLWEMVDTLSDGVVYVMCLATGYKQLSNKELPSRAQAYSKIVPETAGWNNAGTSATSDVSQRYPMYVTLEYGDKILCNLYRVVNIKSETLKDGKVTPTEFSETAYSTKNMYSELLVVTQDPVGNYDKAFYKNYWVVPVSNIKDCVSFTAAVDSGLKDTLRCVKIGDKQYKIYKDNQIKTITTDSNYTIEI